MKPNRSTALIAVGLYGINISSMNNPTKLFVPGCALLIYKPKLASKLKEYIENGYGHMTTWKPCCLTKPDIKEKTRVFTPCVTCAQQYAGKYQDIEVVFILQLIAESEDFPFPDYHGTPMSIQDTCSARTNPKYMAVVRKLLNRMNIKLMEPDRSGLHAKCCGQTFYGKLPIDKVESYMKTRANEMPCDEVVVYCASCIMSMSVGGKRPRYLLDLLFNEPTEIWSSGAECWNNKLKDFRNQHICDAEPH